MRKSILCGLAFIMVSIPLVLWALIASAEPSKQNLHPLVKIEPKYTTQDSAPSPEAGFLQDMGSLTTYLVAIKASEDKAAADATYIAAAQAAQAAQAQEALTRKTASPQYVAAPMTNNGAHSDAWWHGVSICEQGGRNDSYFGYFSIMDGSAGGLDWSTQVAMANAIIARAGDGAWAASCQAAGYAASPGG